MHKFPLLASLLLIMVLGSSCGSNKSMIYLQGADELYKNGADLENNYTLNIQPDDQLAIYISSQDEELMKPFTNLKMIGQQTGMTNSASSNYTYFVVSKDGYIDFPIFGRVKAAGLTVNKLSEQLQNRMISEGLIKDAKVTTKIMSFKVTVLGDVKNPGTQSYAGERLTLLEAIGRAGDLNSSAIRKKVLVIREEDGKRQTFKVDLTQPESVFNSPAYYMHQNDIIYVESNKSVKVKGSSGYLYLGLTGTLLGLGTSIASLIIALTK